MSSLFDVLLLLLVLPVTALIVLVLIALLVCLVLIAGVLAQRLERDGWDLRARLAGIGAGLFPAGSARPRRQRTAAPRGTPSDRDGSDPREPTPTPTPEPGTAEAPTIPAATSVDGPPVAVGSAESPTRPATGQAATALRRAADSATAAARARASVAARSARAASRTTAAPAASEAAVPARPSPDTVASPMPDDAPTAVLPVPPAPRPAARRPGLASKIATSPIEPAAEGDAHDESAKQTALDRLFAPLLESDTTEPLPAPAATKPRTPRRRPTE